MFSKLAIHRGARTLATIVGFVALAAQAQGTRTTLNVSTITTYPPFEYKNPTTDKLEGFEIDIVEAIGAKMGTKISWTQSSFAQLISFVPLTTKRTDVIAAAITDTEERRERVTFVDFVQDPQVFYVLRANAAQFPNMASLCGKRVAVTRSSGVMMGGVQKKSDEHCVKAGKPPLIIVGTDGAPQSRLELTQGRVDLALQGAASLAYQNSMDGNRSAEVGEPAAVTVHGFVVAKEDTQLAQAMKKALGELMADGSYEKLLKKWNMPAGAALPHAMVNGAP